MLSLFTTPVMVPVKVGFGSPYCRVASAGVTVRVAGVIVSKPDPLEAAYVESPAKLAPTPVAYVPALIPVNDTPLIVAVPVAFVVDEPTGLPFNVKVTVLPLNGELSKVTINVVANVTVPP